jgi:MFS family permease
VLCAIYFTLMIGLYGIAFWLPTIVKAFGVKGYLEVGLITAIPYGVAVIGMILLSNHSDQTGERRLHYMANVVAGAVGLILSGVFASSPVLAIIFLSIGTLGGTRNVRSVRPTFRNVATLPPLFGVSFRIGAIVCPSSAFYRAEAARTSEGRPQLGR